MLTRVVSIAVLSLAAMVAIAGEQGPGNRGSGPNRAEYMDKVSILLDLNAGQKAQVQQILDEQHQQMRTQRQALREQAANKDQSKDQRPDFAQFQKQRLQAEKDLIDKLRPVLTDVQLQKFEVLREMTGPRHGPGGPRPLRRERPAQ